MNRIRKYLTKTCRNYLKFSLQIANEYQITSTSLKLEAIVSASQILLSGVAQHLLSFSLSKKERKQVQVTYWTSRRETQKNSSNKHIAGISITCYLLGPCIIARANGLVISRSSFYFPNLQFGVNCEQLLISMFLCSSTNYR